MGTNIETITIDDCPLCRESHKYNLEVQRVTSVGLMDSIEEEGKDRFFTRIFSCPKTGEDFQGRFSISEKPDSKIVKVKVSLDINDDQQETHKPSIQNVSQLTPHSKAVLELGKSLYSDSINKTGDYCKFMISISTGAIPIFIGLLKLILPKNIQLQSFQHTISFIPCLFFLIATGIFTFGFMPHKVDYSIDLIEDIENARERIIKRRVKLIIIGFLFFITGTISCILILLNCIVY